MKTIIDTYKSGKHIAVALNQAGGFCVLINGVIESSHAFRQLAYERFFKITK